MHCFICVTYMIILCSASPTKTREIATTHEKRSLFRDVIESLRIRSRLPGLNVNVENTIVENFEKHKYENLPPELPSDSEYFPRRNDRIEMPSLKYRFPKTMDISANGSIQPVVFVIDRESNKMTRAPEHLRKDKTRINKNKSSNKTSGDKGESDSKLEIDEIIPLSNLMSGQSQIGNREAQTIVKPTVIVNIQGALNKDRDLRLDATDESNSTVPYQNIFNINQEIEIGTTTDKKKPANVEQTIKSIPLKDIIKDDDMMSESSSYWKTKLDSESTSKDNHNNDIFHILFSV